GPVTLPDLGVTVGSENAVQWTLRDAYTTFGQQSERKDALKLLAKTVWEKVVSGRFADAGALGRALIKAIDEKRLMVYLASPKEERQVKKAAMAGELAGGTGDYLRVDVENFGMNKVDYYLRESIVHDVAVGSGASVKTATTVALRNNAPESGLPEYVAGAAKPGAPPGTNEASVSIFVPKGARLLNATIDGKRAPVEVAAETGKAVFSLNVKIPPGASRKCRFDYVVPDLVSGAGGRRQYSLNIQKQPLVDDADYTVTISSPYYSFGSGDFEASGSSMVKAHGELRTDVALGEELRAK
ncbi:MAG: DUF4012 domain-containing protein, partial [Chloroflexi bacterium]|nr:DUF4012 domain-containing protein [Chloroflexota bacterium]